MLDGGAELVEQSGDDFHLGTPLGNASDVFDSLGGSIGEVMLRRRRGGNFVHVLIEGLKMCMRGQRMDLSSAEHLAGEVVEQGAIPCERRRRDRIRTGGRGDGI